MIARVLARLRCERRGATLTEFGLVAPVLLLFLVGSFDIAHSLYLRAVLQGAIQKSARDSTLEQNANPTQQRVIDDKVQGAVDGLTFGERISFQRRFFRTFEKAAAARAEEFTDMNGNARCDNNEQYSDDNNNRVWDADGGDAGQGLAFDRAVYTASVTYPRLFPLWRFVGGSPNNTVKVQTVLMNQPYAGQQSYDAPTARTCP